MGSSQDKFTMSPYDSQPQYSGSASGRKVDKYVHSGDELRSVVKGIQSAFSEIFESTGLGDTIDFANDLISAGQKELKGFGFAMAMSPGGEVDNSTVGGMLSNLGISPEMEEVLKKVRVQSVQDMDSKKTGLPILTHQRESIGTFINRKRRGTVAQGGCIVIGRTADGKLMGVEELISSSEDYIPSSTIKLDFGIFNEAEEVIVITVIPRRNSEGKYSSANKLVVASLKKGKVEMNPEDIADASLQSQNPAAKERESASQVEEDFDPRTIDGYDLTIVNMLNREKGPKIVEELSRILKEVNSKQFSNVTSSIKAGIVLKTIAENFAFYNFDPGTATHDQVDSLIRKIAGPGILDQEKKRVLIQALDYIRSHM